MKLRDILIKSLDIISDDEIDLDIQSKKLTKLISCGNMIYQEIVEQYMPLKIKETLKFKDGVLLYSDFSENVKDILSIRKNGENLNFTLYPSYVYCDLDGTAEVKYIFHPKEAELTDELVLLPQFTPNIIAMGVASEFFYRSGLLDEAIFYKNRYDNAVLNLTRKRSSIQLKARSNV